MLDDVQFFKNYIFIFTQNRAHFFFALSSYQKNLKNILISISVCTHVIAKLVKIHFKYDFLKMLWFITISELSNETLKVVLNYKYSGYIFMVGFTLIGFEQALVISICLYTYKILLLFLLIYRQIIFRSFLK